MKLTVPPPQLSDEDGFTDDADIFRRRDFGDSLFHLLDQVDDELVIVLDAPWGEGKTTFIKMWRGLLHQYGTKNIYFDAYKNDYVEDPFLAMVRELNVLMDKELKDDDAEEFRKKAVSAIKVLGRASLRVAIKAATAGVLDDTVLEGAGAGGELAEFADKIIAEKLTSLESDRAVIDDFRDALESFAEQIGGERKLVFIVDELDRCRPSFALELLEKIKHVLSVPNVVFVLVLHRQQMEEIIKSAYGTGIDASNYLQKFVHIWADLPKKIDSASGDSGTYLSYCLNQMNYKQIGVEEDLAIDQYHELVHFYNMSPREIERSLANFAIIKSAASASLDAISGRLAVFLAIIKVRYPNTYKKLKLGEIGYEELITESELESLRDEDSANYYNEPHILKAILRTSLMSEQELRRLANGDEKYVVFFHHRQTLNYILSWLESFRRGAV